MSDPDAGSGSPERDGATFGGLFVPRGVFNPGHTLCEGQAAISEFAVKTHEAMPLMRHNATNIVVDGDGDEATGSAFLLGYIAGSSYKVITTGRYQDKLTKTARGPRKQPPRRGRGAPNRQPAQAKQVRPASTPARPQSASSARPLSAGPQRPLA